MALDGNRLSTLIQQALKQSDAELASSTIVFDAEGNPTTPEVDTPQKAKEREAQANAIAITIIDYLIANTEVIIPDHPSAVAMTGVGGSPPHLHTTNAPPIPHIIGRIE